MEVHDPLMPEPKHLDESLVVTRSTLTRRRAITLALAFGVAGCRSATSVAVAPSGGATSGAEPPRPTGFTDQDTGPNADPAGNGRGGVGHTIHPSDSDSGPNGDPSGQGHTSITDSDSGPNADRAGHGGTHSLSLPDDPS